MPDVRWGLRRCGRLIVQIEARDLTEAMLVAPKRPAAHLGEHLGWWIEVRPIEGFERQ